MILDPQTLYFHDMWVKNSLVQTDTYLQNSVVYIHLK